MIRAKELEKHLPRGMLRREPGKKGRYQLVLRNLDLAAIMRLLDPLWEAFGANRECQVETAHRGVRWGALVRGRAASITRERAPYTEGWWSWRDGRLKLDRPRIPHRAARELERQIRKIFRWHGLPEPKEQGDEQAREESAGGEGRH